MHNIARLILDLQRRDAMPADGVLDAVLDLVELRMVLGLPEAVSDLTGW